MVLYCIWQRLVCIKSTVSSGVCQPKDHNTNVCLKPIMWQYSICFNEVINIFRGIVALNSHKIMEKCFVLRNKYQFNIFAQTNEKLVPILFLNYEKTNRWQSYNEQLLRFNTQLALSLETCRFFSCEHICVFFRL